MSVLTLVANDDFENSDEFYMNMVKRYRSEYAHTMGRLYSVINLHRTLDNGIRSVTENMDNCFRAVTRNFAAGLHELASK